MNQRRIRDRTFVLVLDYHSSRNWWDDIYPLTSRTANKAFYLDIIRLALDRPRRRFPGTGQEHRLAG